MTDEDTKTNSEDIDETIEPMFDDNGEMKEPHLSEMLECLKLLSKKMEEKPGSTPFDHIGALFDNTSKARLAEAMIEPLIPHWGKAPEGSECSVCHSKNVERSFVMLGGPFAGSYRCLDCGDRRSLMSHIAKTCIKIEPLPPGPLPNYDKETE